MEECLASRFLTTVPRHKPQTQTNTIRRESAPAHSIHASSARMTSLRTIGKSFRAAMGCM